MSRRHYPIKIYPLRKSDGGGWIAWLPDYGWSMCSATGKTPEAALDQLWENKRCLDCHLEQDGVKRPKASRFDSEDIDNDTCEPEFLDCCDCEAKDTCQNKPKDAVVKPDEIRH